MKKPSIRLNQSIREEILVKIKSFIEENYKENESTKEYENLISQIESTLIKHLQNKYKEDIEIFKKYKLGSELKEMFIDVRSLENLRVVSKVFNNKSKWLFLQFEPPIFVPLSKEKRYSGYDVQGTIQTIIEENKDLWELCELADKIRCDLETEKKAILVAYENTLCVNTTKQLLDKWPKMEKFVSFLFKEDQPTQELSETEKLVAQFETE